LRKIKPLRAWNRDHRRVSNFEGRAMKILMPVDGSHVTKRMLSYVAAHEDLLGPGHSYTLLTVVAPVPGYAVKLLEPGTVSGYYLEEAEKVFHPIRSFSEQQGWTCRLVHAHGHAAEVIASVADAEPYDLVVMGAHGHSSLGNVVLGSVTTGVLARCKVPVLVIR
jgi:nucleotide-binding universal stress UspA family protein